MEGGTVFVTKYGNTRTLSDVQAAILLGANGIVMWVAPESFDSITCDELNSQQVSFNQQSTIIVNTLMCFHNGRVYQ